MKKNRKWPTFVLLALFFVGLSVLLYPSLADYWNSKTQSEAIIDYEKMLENLPKEDFTALFEAAEEYNKNLEALDFPLLDYSDVPGYRETLNATGTGIMGYVSIPKIGIELPLYHGTSDAVLAVAIGHLEGSSLPIGGPSTHCVVSAHRGLPSARLFTDLDQLTEGDQFTVTVLDKTLTYEVDQIRIVQPDDVSQLAVIEGEDHLTLLTCTPYGINTERLLVRGIRTDTVVHKTVRIQTEAYQIDTLIVTPIVALPMIFAMMMVVLFKPVKKGD